MMVTRQDQADGAASPPAPTDAPGRCPPQFIKLLKQNRYDIINKWVDLSFGLGPHYTRRTTAELQNTISQSFQANLEALATGKSDAVDKFVAFITVLRLEAGFPLSEVQKAFDLYRVILFADYFSEHWAAWAPWAPRALTAVNYWVSYQIHKFSDEFQALHERRIRRYARDLERKVAEDRRELARSERRYKTLVEEINDGYFAIAEGRIAFANQAFLLMHQATPEQVLSQPFLHFVAAADRGRMQRVYNDTMAGSPLPSAVEYLRLDLAGQERPTEIRAKVVDLGEGPLVIGICQDITARVKMEEKVRENEHLAYVGHLAASLSHEIRNPLSTINLNLQVVARQAYLEAVDRERLDMAWREVARLENILHQLLDLAKPVRPVLAPTDLNRLVAGTLKLLEPQLTSRGLLVGRSLDPSLPQPRVDQAMLEQALFNLLLNAMDEVSEGGRIEVGTNLVTSSTAGRQCALWVADTGPGLSPEDLSAIFTPFYTKKRHGFGLGLTNVKRILEAHGGTVHVESAGRQGAKFTLYLPCEA
ncbi:MAG: PAS domain S-box protein [Deltaproteobacteria bacterium]|nr:PAS domain S-box protein [Deltaproteobacteria bacterium]